MRQTRNPHARIERMRTQLAGQGRERFERWGSLMLDGLHEAVSFLPEPTCSLLLDTFAGHLGHGSAQSRTHSDRERESADYISWMKITCPEVEEMIGYIESTFDAAVNEAVSHPDQRSRLRQDIRDRLTKVRDTWCGEIGE